jgi:conjugative transfer signal peptidase TraF
MLKKYGRPSAIFLMYACMAAGVSGVRINTSYSLPLGLYVESDRGNLIEFCPEQPYAAQSAQRGYRKPGFACQDGAVPLMKPVVATEGDMVEVTHHGIAVNGQLLPKTMPMAKDSQGRDLEPFPMGTYQVEPGTVWVASTYNIGSYDSRYMGPIDARLIRRRLKPLWQL